VKSTKSLLLRDVDRRVTSKRVVRTTHVMLRKGDFYISDDRRLSLVRRPRDTGTRLVEVLHVLGRLSSQELYHVLDRRIPPVPFKEGTAVAAGEGEEIIVHKADGAKALLEISRKLTTMDPGRSWLTSKHPDCVG